ncbi:hypothetical protein MPSEU_000343300 [Mayamaea pseudoterrestris]|nr:hypothetical protein MPSEU_000343300 [Mayamaea pseudoterrestris]
MSSEVPAHYESNARSRHNSSSKSKQQLQSPYSLPSTTSSSSLPSSSSSWCCYAMIFSHLFVISSFFVIGTLYGKSTWNFNASSNDAINDCPLDGEELTRKAPMTDYYYEDNLQNQPTIAIPPEIDGYIAGMARVSRLDLLQKIDTGFPLEASSDGNREIVILYDHVRSLPFGQSAKQFTYYRDSLQALQNCRQLRIVSMDPNVENSNKTCLALHGHSTEPHPLVNTWKQQLQPPQRNGKQQTLQYVVEPKLSLPPKPVTVAAAQQALMEYLDWYPGQLNELKSVLGPIAKRHDKLIVVMVVTAGHLPLLMNYLCACRKAKVDTSGIVVFATDAATYEHLKNVGSITTFNFGPLFAPATTTKSTLSATLTLPDDAEYGTLDYGRIMMSKIYAVHLVNLCGHDVLFQDVDIVPHKADYIDYFVNTVAKRRYPGFDVYMQYDHAAHLAQYAPYGGNSGFYFLKHNAKTIYLMSRLLRSGDLVLKTRSHQATMSMVLSDVSSQYNLRVKVLSSESQKFPVGYHFHHDWNYMRDMMIGRVQPYLLHMNWNHDKVIKQQFLEQMNMWFVNNECLTSDAQTQHSLLDCCIAEPVPVCHYSDKPSVLRECKSFPPIETNVSFW